MGPVNVAIDTNVLIAALRSRNGAAYRLLMSLPNNLYRPHISVPLFFEYEAVAKRTGLVSGLTEKDIDAILDYLLSKSNIREIFYLWRPIMKDPKDDLVLELAVESQSEYIVTFNKNDFQGVEKFGIKAVTPQQSMKERGF